MTRRAKTGKVLLLSPYGRFLGYCNMSFVVKGKRGEKKVPFYKVGEIILQTGNSVSVGALSSAGFWGVDVMVMSASGRPVSSMVSLDDFSHVGTRVAQYEAYKNRAKGIAKIFLLGKIRGQTLLLQKYGLEFKELPLIDFGGCLDDVRHRWNSLESKYSRFYFSRIFKLFPKFLQINRREGFRAYDGTNNLLNFCYMFLGWKVFRALIKAKLEPFLGFLHKVQENRPSLVCDFQELYRYLMDNFIIEYSKKLTKKDFEKHFVKGRFNRKTPRVYLDHEKTNRLVEALTEYFKSRVEVPTMRKRGRSQSLETLICQEASLFAAFLRGEKSDWKPRLVIP